MRELGLLNWGIVAAYLLSNLWLGWSMSRRVKTAADYHVGDRSTPWWAIGISIVATYVSALSFLGAPAWAYGDGMSALAIHVNYPLVVFATVVFFIPFFYNSRVASIYEYLERRFGVRTRALMGLIFMVTMTIGAGSMITATAIVIHSVMGVDISTAASVMTLIVVVYTMMGGMNAVIWTDVLQGVILTIGVLVVIYFVIAGVPSIQEALQFLGARGKLDAIDTRLDLSIVPTIWAGTIAMTLYHITVYGANQFMVQRALAAKTLADAKKSYMVIGFAAFFLYFAFFFVGALLFVHYRGEPFEQPNEIILVFTRSLAIPGLMGVLVAAILSATMSSASSALNSLATVSVTDFYEKFVRPAASDAHYLLVCRLLTVAWGVLLVPVAIAFASGRGSILEAITAAGAYLVGAKLAMFGLGFFSRNVTERGLLVGVAAGFVAVFAVSPLPMMVAGVDAIWSSMGIARPEIAWPWLVVIGVVVNVVVSWCTSVALDGWQGQWHEFSVPGQKAKFAREGRSEKENGWYVVPGRVDRIAWALPVFFVATLLFLLWFETLG